MGWPPTGVTSWHPVLGAGEGRAPESSKILMEKCHWSALITLLLLLAPFTREGLVLCGHTMHTRLPLLG